MAAPSRIRLGRGKHCSKTCQFASQRRTIAQVLRAKVQRCSHGELCPYCCWEWQGFRDKDGYGKITRDRMPRVAARVAWEVWNQQEMPPQLHAAHYCDSPPCCNPLHIRPASAKENVHDAIRAGRMRKGSGVFGSKLTEDDIPAIFQAIQRGESCVTVAQRYGVTRDAIYRVIRRKNWRHIAIP